MLLHKYAGGFPSSELPSDFASRCSLGFLELELIKQVQALTMCSIMRDCSYCLMLRGLVSFLIEIR